MLSYLGTLTCENCGIEFKKRMYYEESRNSKHNYCSRKCKHVGSTIHGKWSDERKKTYGEAHMGENNPNYGKRWSDEQKEEASIRKKQEFADNPQYAYECGKTNRGKKMTPEEIHRMHGHRTFESYSKQHSDASKLLIGIKSKEKFTPEFKDRQRNTMEERGFWVPISEKSEYELYYKDSNWIEGMINFLSEADMEKFKEFGMFHIKNNTKGLVRDHILPRHMGYNLTIPVELMRHPANMALIFAAENIRKGFADRKLSIDEQNTLIEILINKILSFDQYWKEHDICLKIIGEKYENMVCK